MKTWWIFAESSAFESLCYISRSLFDNSMNHYINTLSSSPTPAYHDSVRYLLLTTNSAKTSSFWRFLLVQNTSISSSVSRTSAIYLALTGEILDWEISASDRVPLAECSSLAFSCLEDLPVCLCQEPPSEDRTFDHRNHHPQPDNRSMFLLTDQKESNQGHSNKYLK